MKKIFKFLLIVLLLVGLGAVIAWMVLYQGWRWWIGLALFFGVVGFWLAIIYVRRLIAKQKMRQFVARVVEHEMPSVNPKLNSRVATFSSLQQHWQDAINLIKTAKAEQLPWFLMLGGTQSGKTSAIKHAKLSSALTSIVKNIGIKATENCEWWVLKNSIIVDTTSRYVVPEDENRDSQEWNEFLSLLVKYRKRKPINGVVVTIAADRLLTADSMSLRDEGQNLRKQIDSLMRLCWAKFPVYILITKMDTVFGFSDTVLKLSEEQLSQAAGVNNGEHLSWQMVVNDFFSNLTTELTELRQQVINESREVPSPGMLLLPQEFLALKAGLFEFAEPLFENNAFQEQPICQGIYLASARQDSPATSTILQDESGWVATKASDRQGRGAFLRDFFDVVLPASKDLVEPAYNSLRRRHISSSQGVLSIVFLSLATASLYTADYLHNRNVIHMFLQEYKNKPVLSNDITANLVILDSFQRYIHRLDNSEQSWFLPSLGLTSGAKLIKNLKQEYVALYQQNVLADFDHRFYEHVTELAAASEVKNADELAIYVEYLTARIDCNNLWLANGHFDAKSITAHNFEAIIPEVSVLIYPQLPPSVASQTDETYIAYLEWVQDKNQIQIGQKVMLKMLHDLLENDPDWRIIRNQRAFAPFNVTLNDFWGLSNAVSSTGAEPVMVPGIFTTDGLQQIQRFLNLVAQAGVTSGENDPNLKQFWTWYQNSYYEAWRDFIRGFNQVNIDAMTSDEKRDFALAMVSESNPYWQLIAKAATELQPNAHLNATPKWAQLLIELNRLQSLSGRESAMISLQQQAFQDVNKVVDSKNVAKKAAYFERQVKALGYLTEYKAALAGINPELLSDASYLRYISGVFSEYNGSSDPKSEVSTAFSKFNLLQQLFNSDASDTMMVWRVAAGPLNYLLKYLMMKTACALDNKWQSDIVGQVAMVRGNDLPKALFDKNSGLLWKFLSDSLNPFVNLGRWGYTPRAIFAGTLFEQVISFNPNFMSFLNSARPSLVDYQNQYAVKISTIPISVNSNAKNKPYGVILTLQCADGEQTLKNYNYPDQVTFNWSPDKCGDTTLTILFNNLTLTKTYSGAMGFPKFLADFRTGTYKFLNSDFPQAAILKDNYHVNWIQVKYKLDQNLDAINLLNNVNATLPTSVAICPN